MEPGDRGQTHRLNQFAGPGMHDFNPGPGRNGRNQHDDAGQNREQRAGMREGIAPTFDGGEEDRQSPAQKRSTTTHGAELINVAGRGVGSIVLSYVGCLSFASTA